MSNYYYILSSAKIYFKHFKRLKCYKIIKKKFIHRENTFLTEDINFRIMSRIANRVSYSDLLKETEKEKNIYMANFKDTNTKKETHIDGTCEDDPTHHYLLDSFEANYRGILDTASTKNRNSISSELQDFYYMQKKELIFSHYRLYRRSLNNNFELFFK